MAWQNFFSIVAFLGQWQLVIVLSVLVIILFWHYGKTNYILPLAMTLIGGQLSSSILKRIFERPRPEWGAYAGRLDSFPSGHSVLVMILYGFLMYFIWKNVSHIFWRNTLLIIGAIIILLVGFSRIYLGLHYFTDVLGGYILGALWLGLGIYLHKRNAIKN